ncbi:MAG: MATE family efflux transporter, partial [Lentimicrobiaceae bacterium]|nr:MATE family efflux transporter [Lentimicrobiaceae bacterium]
IGGQILIARRYGERNYAAIGKITDNSLYFLTVLGLALFVFIRVFAGDILSYLIKSEAIYKASLDFLNFRIYGLFFAFANILLRSFFIGITSTRVLTYNAIIMATVNVVLDYALIFGNLGMPEMGIKGAAIASVMAELASAIYFFIYTFYKVDLNTFNLFKFKKVDFAVIRSTLNISIFVMLQHFLSLAGWFTFFMIVEKMGERSLAIANIVRSAYMVLMIPVFAFGSTTNSLVSNIIGQGRHNEVFTIIKKVIVLNFTLIGSIAIILAVFPHAMISIYTNNPEIIRQTIPSFYVVMSALLFFSFSSILFSGVSGTANTATELVIELLTIVVYLSYTWFIARYLQLNITLVWTSEYVYFLFLSLLSFLYLRSGKWRQKVI